MSTFIWTLTVLLYIFFSSNYPVILMFKKFNEKTYEFWKVLFMCEEDITFDTSPRPLVLLSYLSVERESWRFGGWRSVVGGWSDCQSGFPPDVPPGHCLLFGMVRRDRRTEDVVVSSFYRDDEGRFNVRFLLLVPTGYNWVLILCPLKPFVSKSNRFNCVLFRWCTWLQTEELRYLRRGVFSRSFLDTHSSTFVVELNIFRKGTVHFIFRDDWGPSHQKNRLK